jgi:hypothetical protein
MTLGGLALAVGILVDDATVAIENTYRLMEEDRPFREAVVEGAAGIATPALISTLAICSAFVSVFFLTDTPKYLFTPQGLAVVFAMLASYGLSRTLVPIMIDVLVAKECAQRHPGKENKDNSEPNAQPERPSRLRGWFEKIGRAFGRLLPPKLKAARQSGQPGFFRRFHDSFERGFEKFRASYLALVTAAIDRPGCDPGGGWRRPSARRRAAAVHRAGLFPPDQLKHHDFACPNPPRHADRDGDGAIRGDRKRNQGDHPRQGSRYRSRQYRIARQQLQSGLQRRFLRRL